MWPSQKVKNKETDGKVTIISKCCRFTKIKIIQIFIATNVILYIEDSKL